MPGGSILCSNCIVSDITINPTILETPIDGNVRTAHSPTTSLLIPYTIACNVGSTRLLFLCTTCRISRARHFSYSDSTFPISSSLPQIEMSPERLERFLEQTYLFTQMLLSEIEDVTNATEIHALLTAYAKLDTANGNYMLVNTILPEGYGIRSVYQAASPYFTRHQLSFGEFLANRGGVKDPQASRIFAVYDLLTDSREGSYLRYKMLGATGSTFAQHWAAVLDRLAQLLGLDPDAENFRSSLFQQVEAFNIWPDIHALFVAHYPE